MSLEVRIPISAGPSWINRTCLAIHSIRRFYPEAFFRISISPEPGMSMDFPRLSGVTWKVVAWDRFDRWAGTRSEYLETMMDRYTAPFIGDHVLMLDGDVICVRPFPELFDIDAVCGVQSHVPPFGPRDWELLFQGFGTRQYGPSYEHSGWGTMVTDQYFRYSPPYFNSGVVMGPRHWFERLVEPYTQAIEWMRLRLPDTYWFDQTGLALAFAKGEIRTNALGLRFNFPNDPLFDAAHPGELADTRFLHYLRTNVVERDAEFETPPALRRLVNRSDLSGSNELLRQTVACSMSALEPPPLGSPGTEPPWA